ncbi:MAG: cytochrome c [Betaproteobacteria bacterium]|nr:cytochrome c [Betaproteobacteria bacterium]
MRKVVNMINPGFAIRNNVVGLLVVAGWLIGSQSASAQETGQQVFQKSCAACHSIGGGRLVGPDLAGVNDKRPEDWLLKYIKSSQTLVKSGDKTATALFEEFNKIPMPDQALSDDQIKKVLAHIKETGGSPAAGKEAAAPSAQAVKESAAVATPGDDTPGAPGGRHRR